MSTTQATIEAMGGTIVNQSQPETIFHSSDDPYYSLPPDYLVDVDTGVKEYRIRKNNRFSSMYRKRPQSKHKS